MRVYIKCIYVFIYMCMYYVDVWLNKALNLLFTQFPNNEFFFIKMLAPYSIGQQSSFKLKLPTRRVALNNYSFLAPKQKKNYAKIYILNTGTYIYILMKKHMLYKNIQQNHRFLINNPNYRFQINIFQIEHIHGSIYLI